VSLAAAASASQVAAAAAAPSRSAAAAAPSRSAAAAAPSRAAAAAPSRRRSFPCRRRRSDVRWKPPAARVPSWRARGERGVSEGANERGGARSTRGPRDSSDFAVSPRAASFGNIPYLAALPPTRSRTKQRANRCDPTRLDPATPTKHTLSGDGGGAGPNHVCFISPRAFSAKFVDLFVILSFLDVRYVIVPPPLNESF
jgi:hypothetical protein